MKKELLINSLLEKGWYQEEGFLPQELCLELMQECQSFKWKQAQIGKGENQIEELTIRNDRIFWVDEKEASDNQKAYLSKMEELKSYLNRELFLGLNEFECHFAHYEQSGFYKKHLDQHQGSSKRVVSCILYLNQPDSGGELVIYNKHNNSEIDLILSPKAGLFVCFLSNQIYHEVHPTKTDRYSMTGWFRTL